MSAKEKTIEIGRRELEKGEVRNGLQLVAWDSIRDCVPDRCPIGSSCTHRSAGRKCVIQQNYLQAFVDCVFDTYRYLDRTAIYKVGMHLVPMYAQLCRLKIEELSVESVTYEDSRGVTRVHPIFKEIREAMKTIALLWKDLGVVCGPSGDLPPDATGGAPVNNDGFGDRSHYGRITSVQDTEAKRGLVR